MMRFLLLSVTLPCANGRLGLQLPFTERHLKLLQCDNSSGLVRNTLCDVLGILRTNTQTPPPVPTPVDEDMTVSSDVIDSNEPLDVLVDDMVFTPLNASQLAILFPPVEVELLDAESGAPSMSPSHSLALERREEPQPSDTTQPSEVGDKVSNGSSKGKGSRKSMSKGGNGRKSMLTSMTSKSSKGSKASKKAKGTRMSRSMQPSSLTN